ncbi:MAG: hypothetical protein IPJ85_09000 [Flavobacteriales bacterium]|nr:hypothetical protein [Flavobacteriales bacterium]
MKRALLRTALRKEVVGLARVTVIILTTFLLLLEFGYRTDISMSQRMEQLSFGLVGAAAFVMLGSLLRNSLRADSGCARPKCSGSSPRSSCSSVVLSA